MHSTNGKTRKMLVDGMKGLSMIFVGLLLFIFVRTCSTDSRPQANSATPSATGVQIAQKETVKPSVAWDGNPNHADCSQHPDPDHPGSLISDDEGDGNCIPNAPESPATAQIDPLAGAQPDVAHCFKPAWGTLPDKTEGDRKCNPMRRKEQARYERESKKFYETATSARWVKSPMVGPETPKDFDEVYELAGEKGDSPCAEVSISYDGYTVSIYLPDGSERNLKMPTQHMAEIAAVSVCGNGNHP